MVGNVHVYISAQCALPVEQALFFNPLSDYIAVPLFCVTRGLHAKVTEQQPLPPI